MEACKKNPSNHSFKYKLSFHANKEATYCSQEHRGGHCCSGTGTGEKDTYIGHSSGLFVQRGPSGVVGWPGHGTGHLSGDTAGRAVSDSLLKSAVTPGECPVLSASASAGRSRAEPAAFGHGRVCFLTGRLIGQNALVMGQKLSSLGAREAFLGKYSRILPLVRRRSSGPSSFLLEIWGADWREPLMAAWSILEWKTLIDWLIPRELGGDHPWISKPCFRTNHSCELTNMILKSSVPGEVNASNTNWVNSVIQVLAGKSAVCFKERIDYAAKSQTWHWHGAEARYHIDRDSDWQEYGQDRRWNGLSREEGMLSG